jgi:hypothetical protein
MEKGGASDERGRDRDLAGGERKDVPLDRLIQCLLGPPACSVRVSAPHSGKGSEAQEDGLQQRARAPGQGSARGGGRQGARQGARQRRQRRIPDEGLEVRVVGCAPQLRRAWAVGGRRVARRQQASRAFPLKHPHADAGVGRTRRQILGPPPCLLPQICSPRMPLHRVSSCQASCTALNMKLVILHGVVKNHQCLSPASPSRKAL